MSQMGIIVDNDNGGGGGGNDAPTAGIGGVHVGVDDVRETRQAVAIGKDGLEGEARAHHRYLAGAAWDH